MEGGSMAHCILPAGGVSKPVHHRTVEEIWYCIDGDGEVWRKQDDWEEVTRFFPGVSLTIPTGTHLQFHNTGETPLRFIIATMPPWPGAGEAVKLEGGYWEVSQGEPTGLTRGGLSYR
jgi:mannose-6-phosphate isomerase-like protein (cupin superfamily)